VERNHGARGCVHRSVHRVGRAADVDTGHCSPEHRVWRPEGPEGRGTGPDEGESDVGDLMTIDRRFFLRSSIAAGAMLASSGELPAQLVAPRQRTFKLRYAPHFGMFKQHAGEDFVAQLEFMHAEGFTAIEDNDMRK